MSEPGRTAAIWRQWIEAARGSDDEPPRSFASYLLFAGHLLSVAAIALSNILLGLAALSAPWKESRSIGRTARLFLIVLGLYLVGLVGSILASYDPTTSLRATSDLFNFLVPIVALIVVRGAVRARLLVRALVVLGSVVSIQALAQYFAGAGDIDHRAIGPFSHYMTLGGFLVLIDCFLLGWMAFGGGWRRVWAWVAFGLIQLALLVSYTRNAWVALAVVLTLVALLKAPKLLVAWVPVAVVLILIAPSPLLSRFGSIFDLDDQSNYDRLCMGYAGLHMVRDKPVFGQGPGMVRERYELYRHPTTPRLWVPHLHNSFLNLVAERGLVSLVAFLALLVVPTRHAWRAFRRRDGGEDDDLLVATLLVVVATIVTGLFEDYWSDTEIQRLVLFALALPYCIGRSSKDEDRQAAAAAIAA